MKRAALYVRVSTDKGRVIREGSVACRMNCITGKGSGPIHW